MSETTSIPPETSSGTQDEPVTGDTHGPKQAAWRVRAARKQDTPAVAAAVAELLVELGGAPAAPAAMQDATRALIDDPDAGAVLLAELDGELVGVLAASWQTAIHIPGRYALIQDLWVHPAWRSREIGGELVRALSELANEQQIARVEVGLPRESFAGLSATEAFYLRNGFVRLGPRMRRMHS
ncbi:MAG: Branched-chain-amino-acid transaminase [Solirubrobacterales bacterium]|nr:Branched-chain-amino-acid transaminase [Solirubrobacterales bacterium]